MAKAWAWLRKNDPLGATLKGVIVAGFGAAFIAPGGWGLGLIFLGGGLLLVAVPLWPTGRSRRSHSSRRTRVRQM